MDMLKMKKELGEEYQFRQYLDSSEAAQLLAESPEGFTEHTAASLIAGCVRIDAVLFRAGNAVRMGYDVSVKDAPDSPEWVCYDSPEDAVQLEEAEMFRVLDRIVEQDGLSYTDCCFEQLDGKLMQKGQQL